MSRVIKFCKTIRNNWKKSVVGATALAYGVSYAIDYYETNELMRLYCEEAVKYGSNPVDPHAKPPSVTVILNPVAKKRKVKKLFENYCEPLLHLAGFSVTIIQTQSENHARNLLANLNNQTDAIVVAGGDGTLSDVVTGIMRKYKKNPSTVQNCPIGVLPLGQTNKIANSLFFGYDKLYQVKQLAEATMAVIKGKTKLIDTIEIQLLENDPDNPSEPIYSLSSVEWGVWNDAHSRADKYWYWGPLKKYVTYIFNGIKSNMNWDCKALIRYSDPCNGCSNCYQKNQETSLNKKWWHVFIPRTQSFSAEKKVDLSKVINDSCSIKRDNPISTTELQISTRNINNFNQELAPFIKIELGPESISYTEFISEGWHRLRGEKHIVNSILYAKDVELYPENLSGKERMFYIDNEEFDLKPVKLKLLPNSIKVFCPTE